MRPLGINTRLHANKLAGPFAPRRPGVVPAVAIFMDALVFRLANLEQVVARVTHLPAPVTPLRNRLPHRPEELPFQGRIDALTAGSAVLQ